jgi:acyl-homoserine-lactone acylase
MKAKALKTVLIIMFALGSNAATVSAAPLKNDATIKRDTWGVPHVFAQSLADGSFGIGYAQAEDRLEQIFANYREALGRTAEVTDAKAVENDYQARLAGHEAVCRRRYAELPDDVRVMCESFQDGVRAYLAGHPEKKPANAWEMEPWMIAALGRHIVFHWPMGAAKRELGLRAKWSLFSNEWAVRPERTADGAALLLIDPHVELVGLMRFHEFRLHAGGHDVSGFAPAGSPFIGVGHNAFLGWACTTGGPDTTDIYVEKTDGANSRRYRYDDEWREMASETVTIAVKGAPPVVRTLERSHHGPIALREGKKAYAIACPYFGEIDFVTQNYRMMTAHNLAEFDTAAAMCQMMEQNLMYADVEGNIRYIRTGRVPIRPSGFDFSKPVPGETSKSEWLGIHPMKDLVQVLNPATGYLQNCNISPENMARGLNLDLSVYPKYISNIGSAPNNSRGRRAVDLLDSHPKLTVDEAKAIVFDAQAEYFERWQKALREAAAKSPPDKPELRKAVDAILAWDGRMSRDSTAATLYRGWLLVADMQKLTHTSSPAKLISALGETVDWLKKNHGSAEVPWGQLNRIQRGSHSWPFSGGNAGSGMTLRAMESKLEGKVFNGHWGQNWTQLVQFKKGAVSSWSMTPFGESDDPTSPHYSDQAEKLFSRDELKPTWFQPAELEGHIESTKVLTASGNQKR